MYFPFHAALQVSSENMTNDMLFWMNLAYENNSQDFFTTLNQPSLLTEIAVKQVPLRYLLYCCGYHCNL